MSTDETATLWLPDSLQSRATWIRIAQFRTLASVLIPVAAFFVTALGPNRISMALIAGGLSVVSNLAMITHARRGGVLAVPIALTDTLVTLLFVAFVPRAYAAGLIFLAAASALFIFLVGKRHTMWVMGTAFIGFLAIGFHYQPHGWSTLLTIFALSTSVLIATISTIADAAAEANRRYDGMVNGINAVVWEASGLTGDPEYLSQQVMDVLGLTLNECRASGFLASRVHPDDIDSFVNSRREIAQGHDAEVQYRIRDLTGTIRFLQERVTVSASQDGRHSRRGVIVDTTARSVAEASVRGYDDFIAGAPTAMAVLRLDDLDDPQSLRIVNGNPAAATLLGITVDDAVGSLLRNIMPSARTFMERLANVVILKSSLEAPFIRLKDDGSVYSLRAIPLPDHCIGLTIDDVTKAARTAETLKHQALHDHLTGLPNRARFHQRLDRALKVDRRDGSANHVAVLMIDLDKFKDVNDKLGHEYGDKLLIEISRRLGRNVRGCDTIARLGGDEFAILILADDADRIAKDVAGRIEQLIAEPFQLDSYVITVGSSIGLAVRSSEETTARELVRDADNAMYRAKATGGGVVIHQDQSSAGDLSPLSLATDLDGAFKDGEFELRYQPRINLATMEPIGVEALVRWRHPRHGLLGPEQFIEVAEASGAIRSLTRMVAEQAASDLARLDLVHPNGRGPLPVTINVSVANLTDPMFVQTLQDVVGRAGLTASAIRLDVPENQILRDIGQSLSALHELQRLGVGLTLDKFGLGAASVPIIRDLPIDEIKIDRSFVRDIDRGDETLVKTIINLGHEFGLQVAVNGVESGSLTDRLRELGCDTAQGFHLAAPMTGDALVRYLRSFDGSGADTKSSVESA